MCVRRTICRFVCILPAIVLTSVDETVGVTVALRLCVPEAAPEAKAIEQNHNANLFTDFGAYALSPWILRSQEGHAA